MIQFQLSIDKIISKRLLWYQGGNKGKIPDSPCHPCKWRCPAPTGPYTWALGRPCPMVFSQAQGLFLLLTSSNNPLLVGLAAISPLESVHHSRAIYSINFPVFSSGSTGVNLLDTNSSLPQSTVLLPSLNDEAGWKAAVYFASPGFFPNHESLFL